MKSITIIAFSALLCLGNVTINAMDGEGAAGKGAEGGAGSATLAAVAKEPKVYKVLTKMFVVDYHDVVTNGPKVVSMDEVERVVLAAQRQQEAAPQVVSLEDAQKVIIENHELKQSLYRRYPKTALLGIGTLCFVCGLYFSEIRDSVTSKLSSGASTSGQ